MLDKTADFFEKDINEAVIALSPLMNPLIMVILGVLISRVLVTLYLPIFKLGSVV
jgi:type IV pilus assembly protein PilC